MGSIASAPAPLGLRFPALTPHRAPLRQVTGGEGDTALEVPRAGGACLCRRALLGNRRLPARRCGTAVGGAAGSSRLLPGPGMAGPGAGGKSRSAAAHAGMGRSRRGKRGVNKQVGLGDGPQFKKG